MKNFIIFCVILYAGWFFYDTSSLSQAPVVYGPGVKAAGIPEQSRILMGKTFELNGYSITPKAEFKIKAKILSRKDYTTGREADLSPVDFALGWGNMSDESVVKSFTISQSNRWFYWNTDSMPLSRPEIESSCANMHIIPADSKVRQEINKARKGEIIQITGSLVNVKAKDGWSWNSSTSRNDTGSGACELIWVEKFKILPQEITPR